jgi:hypothetical protein
MCAFAVLISIAPWIVYLVVFKSGLREKWMPSDWPNAWCFWVGVAFFVLIVHIFPILVYQTFCCRWHKPLPYYGMLSALSVYAIVFAIYLLCVGLSRIPATIDPTICESMWCGKLVGWGLLTAFILGFGIFVIAGIVILIQCLRDNVKNVINEAEHRVAERHAKAKNDQIQQIHIGPKLSISPSAPPLQMDDPAAINLFWIPEMKQQNKVNAISMTPMSQAHKAPPGGL